MTNYYKAMVIGVIVVGILYLVLLPLYNKPSPEFLGLPFYYWYQIIMAVITTAIYFTISYLIKEAE